MMQERSRPDEIVPLTYQLPLPWEPSVVPMQTPPRAPTVQPRQVWLGLAPTEQGQLQQAVIRIIREVLRDATGH
jgi:hypothetical protein